MRSESCTVVSRAAECVAKLDTQITRINIKVLALFAKFFCYSQSSLYLSTDVLDERFFFCATTY